MTGFAGQQTPPQAVLCALAAGAAFVCVIAPSAIDSGLPEFSVGGVFGVFIGFNAVPMVWSALGPGRLPVRVSLSFLVVLIFFFNFVVGFILAEGGPGSFKEFLQPFGMLPLIFLAFQMPFALMRMVTGWRIERASDDDEQGHQRRQFGIAQLLVVTTFIAFALAMARWSLSQELGAIPWVVILMQMGIMLIWVSAVGPLCLWSVFRVRLLSVSAVITALHAGLLTLVVIVIVQILNRGATGMDFIPFTICLHAATFAVLWSGLAIMRWLGYSLGLVKCGTIDSIGRARPMSSQ